MRKITVMILIILLITCYASFAETIKLKNGKIFEGPIVEKQSDYLVIEYRKVPLKYHLDEIESIDGINLAPAESKEEIEKEKSQFAEKVVAFQENAKLDKTYYPNGKLKSEGNVLNGNFRTYYENGQISSEGNYKDGKPWNGVMKYYREDGAVKLEQNYKEGLLLGKDGLPMNDVVRIYSGDGKLEDECPYKDGKRHGISKTYKKDGKMIELGWNQGEMTGYFKSYNEKGEIEKTFSGSQKPQALSQ